VLLGAHSQGVLEVKVFVLFAKEKRNVKYLSRLYQPGYLVVQKLEQVSVVFLLRIKGEQQIVHGHVIVLEIVDAVLQVANGLIGLYQPILFI